MYHPRITPLFYPVLSPRLHVLLCILKYRIVLLCITTYCNVFATYCYVFATYCYVFAMYCHVSLRIAILYSKLYVAVENIMENRIKISLEISEIVPQLLPRPCRRTTAATTSAGDDRCRPSCIVHEQADHAVRHRHRRTRSGTTWPALSVRPSRSCPRCGQRPTRGLLARVVRGLA